MRVLAFRKRLIIMAMKGVGTSLGPQLMVKIGDVARFTHKGAITAFAGVDPGVNQSRTYKQKSVHASKRGTPILRKTLFQVMDVLIKIKPQDDTVYLFMDKKHAQGKCFVVHVLMPDLFQFLIVEFFTCIADKNNRFLCS